MSDQIYVDVDGRIWTHPSEVFNCAMHAVHVLNER